VTFLRPNWDLPSPSSANRRRRYANNAPTVNFVWALTPSSDFWHQFLLLPLLTNSDPTVIPSPSHLSLEVHHLNSNAIVVRPHMTKRVRLGVTLVHDKPHSGGLYIRIKKKNTAISRKVWLNNFPVYSSVKVYLEHKYFSSYIFSPSEYTYSHILGIFTS
jgi:hypothetical protein